MTNKQLTSKIEKTLKTINNLISSGGAFKKDNSMTSKSLELARRYDEIADEMFDRDLWDSYCDKYDFCRTHDAGDVYA